MTRKERTEIAEVIHQLTKITVNLIMNYPEIKKGKNRRIFNERLDAFCKNNAIKIKELSDKLSKLSGNQRKIIPSECREVLFLEELERAGLVTVEKEELLELKEEIADCEKSAELRFEIIREADEYWRKILNKPATHYSDMRQLIKFLMDRIKELEKQNEEK